MRCQCLDGVLAVQPAQLDQLAVALAREVEQTALGVLHAHACGLQLADRVVERTEVLAGVHGGLGLARRRPHAAHLLGALGELVEHRLLGAQRERVLAQARDHGQDVGQQRVRLLDGEEPGRGRQLGHEARHGSRAALGATRFPGRRKTIRRPELSSARGGPR